MQPSSTSTCQANMVPLAAVRTDCAFHQTATENLDGAAVHWRTISSTTDSDSAAFGDKIITANARAQLANAAGTRRCKTQPAEMCTCLPRPSGSSNSATDR